MPAGGGQRVAAGPEKPDRPAPRSARRQPGFSLLELLLVLALVGVLASLLLSSLAAAHNRAIKVNCLGNLRQLGLALQMYLVENRSFPLATDGDGLGYWQRALRPLASENLMYCPQIQVVSNDFLQYFPSNQCVFPHYGYNASGAMRINPPPQNPGLGGNFTWTAPGVGGYTAASENWVRVPDQMVALGDGTVFWPPPPGAAAVTPADPLYTIFPFILQPKGYYGVNQNHDRGANLLFCDGHVEYGRQSFWLAPADASKRLWNNDNQSHPEFQ